MVGRFATRFLQALPGAWLLLAASCTTPLDVSAEDLPPPPRTATAARSPAPAAAPAAPVAPAATVTLERAGALPGVLGGASYVPPSPQGLSRSISRQRFIVDAGHGGKDPGTQGRSAVAEKHITLLLAREIARRIAVQGGKVQMTRDDDVFVELDERARLADRARADLFISVHADAAERASASGVTVWIGRGALPESRRAATAIDMAIRAAGIESRGVREAGFKVLVGHQRPAVLIECGYLTNEGDARRLNDAAYRRRLAAAIVEGVVAGVGL